MQPIVLDLTGEDDVGCYLQDVYEFDQYGAYLKQSEIDRLSENVRIRVGQAPPYSVIILDNYRGVGTFMRHPGNQKWYNGWDEYGYTMPPFALGMLPNHRDYLLKLIRDDVYSCVCADTSTPVGEEIIALALNFEISLPCKKGQQWICGSPVDSDMFAFIESDTCGGSFWQDVVGDTYVLKNPQRVANVQESTAALLIGDYQPDGIISMWKVPASETDADSDIMVMHWRQDMSRAKRQRLT